MKRNSITITKYICAIVVIFFHTSPLTGGTGWISSCYTYLTRLYIFNGQAAVSIIFLLSGFLYLQSYQTNKNNFCKRKIVRLLLPLTLVVVMCIFLGSLISSKTQIEYWTSKETYLYLLNAICIPQHNLPGVFTSNPYLPTVNGSLWTMSITLASYISCYLVVKSKLHENKYFKFYLITMIGIYYFLICINANNYIISAVYPLVYFYIGVWFKQNIYRIKFNYKILIVILIIYIISIIYNITNYTHLVFIPYVVMYIINKDKGSDNGIKDYSYEMYLWGWPVQQFLVYISSNTMNQLIHFIIAILVSLTLGVFTSRICKKVVFMIETKN